MSACDVPPPAMGLVDHAYQMGRRHEREDLEIQGRIADVAARLRGARPCCIRRARARYWRLVRGYVGLGMALGIAVGMVLGAMVKP